MRSIWLGRRSGSASDPSPHKKITLIIGLGNVGREYEGTRHNTGFTVADALAEREGAHFRLAREHHAEVAEIVTPSEKRILAKPTTFVNKSGDAARSLVSFYKPTSVIAVYDDADLPLGEIRVRTGGGSAGHNGVKSLIEALGENNFLRVRVGIGRPADSRTPLEAWVLGKWTEEEKIELQKAIEKGAERLREMT